MNSSSDRRGARITTEPREFFRQHGRVRMLMGDAVLDPRELAPPRSDPLLIRIGTETAHTEFVVLPGEEGVYELEAGERDDAQLAEYPGLHHLILCLCATIHGGQELVAHGRIREVPSIVRRSRRGGRWMRLGHCPPTSRIWNQ